MRTKRRQLAANSDTEAAFKGNESKVIRIGFCTIIVRQQLPLFLHGGILKMAVEQDIYVVAVQETGVRNNGRFSVRNAAKEYGFQMVRPGLVRIGTGNAMSSLFADSTRRTS